MRISENKANFQRKAAVLNRRERSAVTWAQRELHSRCRKCRFPWISWHARSPAAFWAQSPSPGHIHSCTPPAWILPWAWAAGGAGRCRAAPPPWLSECAPLWNGFLPQPGGSPCRMHLPAWVKGKKKKKTTPPHNTISYELSVFQPRDTGKCLSLQWERQREEKKNLH